MQELMKKAQILVEALPYIQKFFGKTVVIKYGGNAMINDELKNSVMEDITLLKYIGMNPVVIHGGGPEINKALTTFGIESNFIDGLRVTDEQTMQVAQMVLVGKTNKEVVSLLNQKGGKAIGLCGIDGNLIECEKYLPLVNGVPTDIGFVGKVTNINTKLIEMLAEDGLIPVIAPIGVGANGESFNINADTVAGDIAVALKAEKLILLTDIEGVKLSVTSEEILSELTIEDVKSHIDSGVISGGMIPKVLGCVEAIEGGVNKVHIIDGRQPHCLLLEIFTKHGIGTLFTA
ncbi:MAG: acetylglutamate kinase [Bacillota bacterium]